MRRNFENGMRFSGHEITVMFLRQSEMITQSAKRDHALVTPFYPAAEIIVKNPVISIS